MRVAPAASARLIGTLLTTPPSTRVSPSITTGGKMAGMAAEASSASTTGPWVIHRSAPSVIEVATTSMGTGASSRRSKAIPSSMTWCRPEFGWTEGRCWKKVQGPWTRVRGNTVSPDRARQTSCRWSMPRGVGSPQ